jgi:hypothetical protein
MYYVYHQLMQFNSEFKSGEGNGGVMGKKAFILEISKGVHRRVPLEGKL